MAKALTREELITSLTVPHHEDIEPDLDPNLFTADQLDEMSLEQLQALRASTKKRRKPRATGGTRKPRAPRKTLGTTGQFDLTFTIQLSDEEVAALRTVNVRNAADAAAYFAPYFSANADSGYGAGCYIDKDDRVDGCTLVPLNKGIAAGIDAIEQVAKQTKRLAAMRKVYDDLNSVRDLIEDLAKAAGVTIEQWVFDTLNSRATDAGYTDDQKHDCLVEIFGDDYEEVYGS